MYVIKCVNLRSYNKANEFNRQSIQSRKSGEIWIGLKKSDDSKLLSKKIKMISVLFLMADLNVLKFR